MSFRIAEQPPETVLRELEALRESTQTALLLLRGGSPYYHFGAVRDLDLSKPENARVLIRGPQTPSLWIHVEEIYRVISGIGKSRQNTDSIATNTLLLIAMKKGGQPPYLYFGRFIRKLKKRNATSKGNPANIIYLEGWTPHPMFLGIEVPCYQIAWVAEVKL